MQPFGFTNYVQPSNWRQNISSSKSTEVTDKTGTPEKISVIICEMIVHLLVIVQNKKRCTVQVLKYCRLFLFQVGAIGQRSAFRTTEWLSNLT